LHPPLYPFPAELARRAWSSVRLSHSPTSPRRLSSGGSAAPFVRSCVRASPTVLRAFSHRIRRLLWREVAPEASSFTLCCSCRYAKWGGAGRPTSTVERPGRRSSVLGRNKKCDTSRQCLARASASGRAGARAVCVADNSGWNFGSTTTLPLGACALAGRTLTVALDRT
jgi:hypothetical protein